MSVKAQRRLLRLVAVGNQPRHQVDEEVEGAAMPGMLDLRDVLELIDAGWGADPRSRIPQSRHRRDHPGRYIGPTQQRSKPRQTDEPCWRLSVARGVGAVLQRDELGWKAQLTMMAAQLQVEVVAHFADGSVGPASRRFSVGESLG